MSSCSLKRTHPIRRHRHIHGNQAQWPELCEIYRQRQDRKPSVLEQIGVTTRYQYTIVGGSIQSALPTN